jgi:hypothetical protein
MAPVSKRGVGVADHISADVEVIERTSGLCLSASGLETNMLAGLLFICS